MKDYNRGEKFKEIADKLKKTARWSMIELAEDGLEVKREYMYRLFKEPEMPWKYIVKGLAFMKYRALDEFPDMPNKEREKIDTLLNIASNTGLIMEPHTEYSLTYEMLHRERDEWRNKYIMAIERENRAFRGDLPVFHELKSMMTEILESLNSKKDMIVK